MGLLDQLSSFAQGASNSVAGTVSAPVDGIAWLLNKAGMNIKSPVGGSDWMAQQGLTAVPKQHMAGLFGEGIGAALPSVIAAKAPQIAAGAIKAGQNAMSGPAIRGPLSYQDGAIQWHGTPHTFDKFDASKIGTGEGAQAYGHGLYLADSQDVAQGYKTANSYRAFDIGQEAAQRGIPLSAGARGEFVRQAASNADPVKATQALQNANAATRSIPSEDLHAMFSDYQKKAGGSLYKVDLPDEHIARMLDWDKPLNQQHPETLNALRSLVGDYPMLGESMHPLEMGSTTGASVNRILGGGAAASQAMKKAGISGIRYLDGGSRSAAEGTRNTVIFPGNEGLLNILERNGIPLNK